MSAPRTRSQDLVPIPLAEPALFDTGVWTWVRDKRFPHLAEWFNEQVTAGIVLVCDLVVLELVRVTANARRAQEVSTRLSAFESVEMNSSAWSQARRLQLLLADQKQHRSVPPADLLIAASAEAAGVPVVHYDRDYERIAAVGTLDQRWLVADGALA